MASRYQGADSIVLVGTAPGRVVPASPSLFSTTMSGCFFHAGPSQLSLRFPSTLLISPEAPFIALFCGIYHQAAGKPMGVCSIPPEDFSKFIRHICCLPSYHRQQLYQSFRHHVPWEAFSSLQHQFRPCSSRPYEERPHCSSGFRLLLATMATPPVLGFSDGDIPLPQTSVLIYCALQNNKAPPNLGACDNKGCEFLRSSGLRRGSGLWFGPVFCFQLCQVWVQMWGFRASLIVWSLTWHVSCSF